MWYLWTVLLVVSSALVSAEAAPARAEAGAPSPATTRAPPRTLDRQAAELAWPVWLKSPESGNQNAPPRRITTKSLFITPLICPKGQRLDSNGCVQGVTLGKEEHERILLDQLNALFTSAPSGDVVYDYGDDEPGPLQLSIPIALDAQAERLQAQEPSAQAQQQNPVYAKPDKKDGTKTDAAAGLVAELELLQLQHAQNSPNETASAETSDVLNHNVLQALEKPKRNSPDVNSTESEISDVEEGQKEVVFGHVNIDPVVYNTETETEPTTTEADTEVLPTTETQTTEANPTEIDSNIDIKNNKSTASSVENFNNITTNTTHMLKKDTDRNKLNPENDYADIGEAIKLISRYAEVTTDDNFNKDQNKFAIKDDSILGTRTKSQYRRKPKPNDVPQPLVPQAPLDYTNDKMQEYPKKYVYYRYPWQSQHSLTPPPDYPFHHIQDYWPGRNQIGGVYNTAHGNPRRHHHMYPHNYYRSHNMPYAIYPNTYPGPQEAYLGTQAYPRGLVPPRGRPLRAHGTNQDLYTLLGLRHWFSSEGTSKR